MTTTAIDRILGLSFEKSTKKESKDRLISCGILKKDGKPKKAFEDILINKEKQ